LRYVRSVITKYTRRSPRDDASARSFWALVDSLHRQDVWVPIYVATAAYFTVPASHEAGQAVICATQQTLIDVGRAVLPGPDTDVIRDRFDARSAAGGSAIGSSLSAEFTPAGAPDCPALSLSAITSALTSALRFFPRAARWYEDCHETARGRYRDTRRGTSTPPRP
jgi:hypothetical protein